MELVIIESPWKATSAAELSRNRNYAQKAMVDCIDRGEAPFASHLLYTQIFDELIDDQRSKGIDVGLAWGRHATKTVVYQDFGITSGMVIGIKRAIEEGRGIEYRSIEGYFEDYDKNLTCLAGDICRHYSISLVNLTSKSRAEEVVIPRCIYYKVARTMFPKVSLARIGDVVNRDHATVYNGLQQVENKFHIRAEFIKFCSAKNIRIE